MNAHSEWSPSAAERWIACPASIKLSRGVPPREAGEAAKIGTAVHALAETVMLTGSAPHTFVGKEFEGVAISEEMASWAEVYTDFAGELEKRMESACLIEERLRIPNYAGADVYGTADLVCFNDTDLVVGDLKTGRIKVDVEGPQLKIYALGALQKAPASIKNITLAIIQPTQEPQISLAFMTKAELIDWSANVLEPALRDTLAPFPPTNEGEHCRWCPARSKCPAKIARVESFAGVTPKQIDEATEEELNAMMNVADDALHTIEAIKERVTNALQAGRELHDWTLIPKRATRKWQSDELMAGLLSAHKGAVKTVPITPAQLEKKYPNLYQEFADKVTAESSGLTLGRKPAPNLTSL